MPRSTAEIPPECRECLGVVEAVGKVAFAQSQLNSELAVYGLDRSGNGVTYSGKLSDL